MAEWLESSWPAPNHGGLAARDRKHGAYSCYLPDPLTRLAIPAATTLSRVVGEAERAVAALNDDQGDLHKLGRLLVRSEAIASSRIEGIAPSARNVAIAELSRGEPLAGVREDARHVANNVAVVQQAVTKLTQDPVLSVRDLVEVHKTLLDDEPRHHGLRSVQNWIGGSAHHPLDADFVPPPPEKVPELMEDLVHYMGGAWHSPVVQAALVHAQFETIHPFTDGNGRLGRALIHTVLHRRGLMSGATLPISLIFATFSQQYVAGLSAFRYAGDVGSMEAVDAVTEWIAYFCQVTLEACRQAESLKDGVAELRQIWADNVERYRKGQGLSRKLRSDSATARVLSELPGIPVLTAETIVSTQKVSRSAALAALEELTSAGVLTVKKMGPSRMIYVAESVLELVTWTERKLASTRFDTQVSRPHRGAPAAPQ